VSSTADLRVHLMCNHRKSELTDDLLEQYAHGPPPTA
jgi:hypothetical protein